MLLVTFEDVPSPETANDDLSNLLSSTDIATIFLGTELCIRRFTPATRALVHLLPIDEGRPSADIAPRFTYNEEFRVLHPKGKVRWQAGMAIPLTDHDGTVKRLIGLFHRSGCLVFDTKVSKYKP